MPGAKPRARHTWKKDEKKNIDKAWWMSGPLFHSHRPDALFICCTEQMPIPALAERDGAAPHFRWWSPEIFAAWPTVPRREDIKGLNGLVPGGRRGVLSQRLSRIMFDVHSFSRCLDSKSKGFFLDSWCPQPAQLELKSLFTWRVLLILQRRRPNVWLLPTPWHLLVDQDEDRSNVALVASRHGRPTLRGAPPPRKKEIASHGAIGRLGVSPLKGHTMSHPYPRDLSYLLRTWSIYTTSSI